MDCRFQAVVGKRYEGEASAGSEFHYVYLVLMIFFLQCIQLDTNFDKMCFSSTGLGPSLTGQSG